LNTTSRIEGKCKDLGQKLLISEKSLNIINLSNEFIAELKGKVELKGKTEKLNLYGVRKLTAGNV
jgi:adenylate cyclase